MASDAGAGNGVHAVAAGDGNPAQYVVNMEGVHVAAPPPHFVLREEVSKEERKLYTKTSMNFQTVGRDRDDNKILEVCRVASRQTDATRSHAWAADAQTADPPASRNTRRLSLPRLSHPTDPLQGPRQ
jgi:hypothetical protein